MILNKINHHKLSIIVTHMYMYEYNIAHISMGVYSEYYINKVECNSHALYFKDILSLETEK